MHFKQALALRYAELVYYGWWFSPLREAMDAFVKVVMRNVTGEVRLKLYKGNVWVVGRRSPYSLYREDIVSFDAVGAYDHKDAAGFIRLFGLPLKVHGLVRRGLRGEPRAPEERD
jgi:argininosuccinate synthase